MSDFLRELAGRSLGLRDVVRPRLGATFEPGGLAVPASSGETLELETAPAEPVRTPPRPSEVPGLTREPAAARRGSGRARSRPAEPPGRRAAAVERAADSRRTIQAPEPSARTERQSPAPERPSVRPEPARPLNGDTAPEPPAMPPRDPAPSPASGRAVTRRRGRRPDATDAAPTVMSNPLADEPPPAEPLRARPVETRLAEPPPARAPGGAGEPAAARRVRGRASAPDEAGDEAPVVHVHVDRIEVRAPAPPTRRRAPKPREPLLSLDDYLAEGTGRRR